MISSTEIVNHILTVLSTKKSFQVSLKLCCIIGIKPAASQICFAASNKLEDTIFSCIGSHCFHYCATEHGVLVKIVRQRLLFVTSLYES